MEKAIKACLIAENEDGECANLTEGLFAIARAIQYLAHTVERLGLNGASTGMGAIEVLSLEVRELANNISNGLMYLADQQSHD
jgi:hypothetical protein